MGIKKDRQRRKTTVFAGSVRQENLCFRREKAEKVKLQIQHLQYGVYTADEEDIVSSKSSAMGLLRTITTGRQRNTLYLGRN